MTSNDLDRHIDDRLANRLREVEIETAVRARDIATLTRSIERLEDLVGQITPLATQVTSLSFALAENGKRWERQDQAQTRDQTESRGRSNVLIGVAVAAVLSTAGNLLLAILNAGTP